MTATLEPEDVSEDPKEFSNSSLSDRIYRRLRYALMTGFYEPGSRLSIRRLATVYKTSPTPVREAIFQLIREGALELRLGHQPRVPMLSVSRYLDIRETRVPLERLATELACVRIEDEQISRLRDLHQRFIGAQNDRRWKEALAANQEFHFTIYGSSGNEVLVQNIENLWLLTGPFVNIQYPLPENVGGGPHLHILLIDALTRRAPAEAGELAVRDIREGGYIILERMKASEARLRRNDEESPEPARRLQKTSAP